jgi:hypothetical protein
MLPGAALTALFMFGTPTILLVWFVLEVITAPIMLGINEKYSFIPPTGITGFLIIMGPGFALAYLYAIWDVLQSWKRGDSAWD